MIRHLAQFLRRRMVPATRGNVQLGFEQLEDRMLLSAGLLNLAVDYPAITFNSGTPGSMVYDASTQTLHAQATPFLFRASSVSVPTLVAGPSSVTFDMKVDNTGALIGGVAGDDLTVTGGVDVDGNGSIDYSGVLLTGEIIEFGALDSGTTDQYDFRFAATGGALVTAGYFNGMDIGVQANSLNSSFTSDWAVNFDGTVEGVVGTTAPKPDIDVEKYVKLYDDCKPEGFDPCFWLKCQNAKYWVNFKPTDKFEDVFGVDIKCKNPTLKDALGGCDAFQSEAVAALLNASNGNVNFAYSVDEVKAMVRQAFGTCKADSVRKLFACQNDLGGDITKGCDTGFGIDADNAPGLVIPVGSKVIYTYVVTNTGGTTLSNIVLTDDNATVSTSDDFAPTPMLDGGYNVGDVNHNGLLDVDEQWLYTACRTIQCAKQYTNTANVVGTPIDEFGNIIGANVTDSDPAVVTATSKCDGHDDHKCDWDWGRKCGDHRDYGCNNDRYRTCGHQKPKCGGYNQATWSNWKKSFGSCGFFSFPKFC